MKKENKKLLAWVLSFAMLFGCFVKTDPVRASEGEGDNISVCSKRGQRSDLAERVAEEPTSSSEATSRPKTEVIQPVVSDNAVTYASLGANEEYCVNVSGKEAFVSENDIAKFEKVFNTEDVYTKWTAPNEIVKSLDNGTVITAISDETNSNNRVVTVNENGTEKTYAVAMEKNEDNSIKATIMKKDAGAESVTTIVKVSGDTVIVTRDSVQAVTITKNADGSYNVVADPAWAEKQGLELSKVVKQEEPTPTATSTATPTVTSTESPTPTATGGAVTTTPTVAPSIKPSTEPSTAPSIEPPTTEPTDEPTQGTEPPTAEPTTKPTASSTATPTQTPKSYFIGQTINIKKELKLGKKFKITKIEIPKYKECIKISKGKGTITIVRYLDPKKIKKGERKSITLEIKIWSGKKKWIRKKIKVIRPELEIKKKKNEKTIEAYCCNFAKTKRIKLKLQIYSKKEKRYVSPDFFSKHFKKKKKMGKKKKKMGEFKNPTKLPTMKYRLCVTYKYKKKLYISYSNIEKK